MSWINPPILFIWSLWSSDWLNLNPQVPLTMIALEVSLYSIWRSLQEYILLHSDDILVNLSDKTGLNWLVCQLCCGRHSCPDIFAEAFMKVASFALLLSVCSFLKLHISAFVFFSLFCLLLFIYFVTLLF